MTAPIKTKKKKEKTALDPKLRNLVEELRLRVGETILGQDDLIRSLLIALLGGGHLLVEGLPGLAKTQAALSLAEASGLQFKRIQFTPDMLPSDITGSETLSFNKSGSINQKTALRFVPGPIFAQLVLADEINRAPAKVQAALLEAMAESKVTVGGTTHELGDPFVVVATMNPIDNQGTWQLPQAQLDRFLMKVNVTYPAQDVEYRILQNSRLMALRQLETSKTKSTIIKVVKTKANKTTKKAAQPDLLKDKPLPPLAGKIYDIRREIMSIYCGDSVLRYIVNLTNATRPDSHNAKPDIKHLVAVGVSPRGAIGLETAARTSAWLENRDFVTPDDVLSVIYPVFRHRIIPSVEARLGGLYADQILEQVIASINAT